MPHCQYVFFLLYFTPTYNYLLPCQISRTMEHFSFWYFLEAPVVMRQQLMPYCQYVFFLLYFIPTYHYLLPYQISRTMDHFLYRYLFLGPPQFYEVMDDAALSIRIFSFIFHTYIPLPTSVSNFKNNGPFFIWVLF